MLRRQERDASRGPRASFAAQATLAQDDNEIWLIGSRRRLEQVPSVTLQKRWSTWVLWLFDCIMKTVESIVRGSHLGGRQVERIQVLLDGTGQGEGHYV